MKKNYNRQNNSMKANNKKIEEKKEKYAVT